MNKDEYQKNMDEIEYEMQVENRKGDLRRARSVTVGTSFGGVTELMMRNNDGNIIWTPMQPVEVVELIHQLAANIGCHIHIQPRQDFASWRAWPHAGHAPHAGHPPLAIDSVKQLNLNLEQKMLESIKNFTVDSLSDLNCDKKQSHQPLKNIPLDEEGLETNE